MKMSSTTRKTRKKKSIVRKAKVPRATKRTRRMPSQVSVLVSLTLTLHSAYPQERSPRESIGFINPIRILLPQCAVLNTVHAWLTLVQEQAPPKKKLKTAPVVEAAHKNGTAANGHGEGKVAEGEEDEEFDEEDEEDEEAEGE